MDGYRLLKYTHHNDPRLAGVPIIEREDPMPTRSPALQQVLEVENARRLADSALEQGRFPLRESPTDSKEQRIAMTRDFLAERFLRSARDAEEMLAAPGRYPPVADAQKLDALMDAAIVAEQRARPGVGVAQAMERVKVAQPGLHQAYEGRHRR